MDRLTTNSSSSTGDPRWVTYRIVEDGVAVEVYPRFATSMDIFIEGLRAPTIVDSEDDVLDLPTELTTPVVLYMVARAKFKDEEDTQYRFAMGAFAAEMQKLAERRTQIEADQHNRVRSGRAITIRDWRAT